MQCVTDMNDRQKSYNKYTFLQNYQIIIFFNEVMTLHLYNRNTPMKFVFKVFHVIFHMLYRQTASVNQRISIQKLYKGTRGRPLQIEKNAFFQISAK